MKTLISILLALTALTSCRPAQLIKADGTTIEKEFTFHPENTILSVTNTFNVILDDTLPAGTAIVETDRAVMEHVLVKSNDEKVLIRLRGRWRVSPVPMNVRISPSSFDDFRATGACEIVSEIPLARKEVEAAATGVSTICLKNLTAEEVEADATGTSTVILHGTAQKGDFSATGLSKVEASALGCQEVEVQATGTSTIHVNALQRISGSNIGMSTVRYTGSPAKVNVTNVGMSSVEVLP